MKRNHQLDTDRLNVVEMYNKNIPLKDIAKHYNVNVSTVCERLKSWGVEFKGNRHLRRIPQELGAEIKKMYVNENLTVNEIARKLGIGVSAIRFFFEREGVSKHENGDDKFEKNKDEIVRLYTIEKISLKKIGAAFGITQFTLSKNLKNLNVKVEDRALKLDIPENKDKIVDLFFNQHVSREEIGKMFGTSANTIYEYLIKWGFELKHKKHNTSIEMKVKGVLDAYGVNYIRNFKSDRKEFDFLLTDFNTLIEVQGDYWHGNEKIYITLDYRQQKNKARDVVKREWAEKNNYSIVYFWESEINKNIEVVIDKIKKVCKITTN